MIYHLGSDPSVANLPGVCGASAYWHTEYSTEDPEIAKLCAVTSWLAEKASLEIGKRRQIAELTVSVYANMLSAWGYFFKGRYFESMAMVLVADAANEAIIALQTTPVALPPPELFLAQGGIVHSGGKPGGITVQISPGKRAPIDDSLKPSEQMRRLMEGEDYVDSIKNAHLTNRFHSGMFE